MFTVNTVNALARVKMKMVLSAPPQHYKKKNNKNLVVVVLAPPPDRLPLALDGRLGNTKP